MLLLADWELKPSNGPQRPAPQMAWVALALLYQQVAEELKAEFIELLDMHQENGMNAIIFQVRPAADAFYL